MKLYFLPILFCCTSLLSWAQPDTEFIETNSAKKSLRFAQDFINKGKLEKARKQLKHTIKIKEDFAVAHRELGMVCLELDRFTEAIEAYELSFELDDKLSRAAFFECGEAHFKSGDIEMALHYFQKYQDLTGKSYANKQKESDLEIEYDLLLPERMNSCNYITQMDTSGVYVQPVNMGKNINSKYDDYLPTITSDGAHLVYTRTEKGRNQNILTSRFKDLNWQKSKSFGSQLNTNKNEGMAKFEAHGRSFYFAGCMREDTEGGCDIYQADLDNGEITAVTRLEGHLNSRFWDSQPSVTCDGTTMYFSSSREGGLGGADIWVSRRQKNGDWGYPENLGPSINTSGDEEAPYISNDGHTIYFSSTGHLGQGEGDLFIARHNGSTWEKAINMDYPINSPAKEMGIYVQADGKTAFYSSARSGGRGGLDIYSIELAEKFQPKPIVQLEGTVVDAVSGEPVECTVKISRKEEKLSIQTNEEGWFFLCLPGDKGYSFQINEKGYEYLIDAQFLAAQDNKTPIKIALQLQPNNRARPELVAKGIVEPQEKRVQFFFDFDSHDLSEQSITDLTALAAFLKKEHDWQLEVVGYADQKGDHQYNLRLSQLRARSIVDFLNRQGIDIKQVVRNEGKGSLGTQAEESRSRRVDVILRK